MISGLLREISFVAITWNPESNCTCREKNHFLIPLKYIDVTRTTHTSLDVLLEKQIEDYWNVDGDRELSGTWTGFTNFTILKEKPLDGFSWSERRLTKNKQPPGLVKMEDAPSLLKLPKTEFPEKDTTTKTQMAKVMDQYGRSSRSSQEKYARSSFGRTIIVKAI